MPRLDALLMRLRPVALLLLAVIAIQAAQPARAGAFVTASGPAWSAWTVDVAVVAQRKAETREVLAARFEPMLAPGYATVVTPPSRVKVRCTYPAFARPQSRAPPPRLHPARTPDCTAPPLA